MTTELSPVEELAFPFVQAAVRMNEMKDKEEARSDLLEAVNRNAALWMYFEKQVAPSAMELKDEARELVARLSKFMLNSSVVLGREYSQELVDRIIDINLNMSEQILAAPATVH